MKRGDHSRKRDVPREPPVVNGRVPPHDLDAEAAVLSTCLLSHDDVPPVLGVLRKEHFYSEPNRLIFEAIAALEAAGNPIDVVTVGAWLRSRELIQRVDVSYLGRIVDATPAVAHVIEHANIVLQRWRQRRVIAECHKHAALGYGDVGDPEEYIATAEREILETTRQDARRPVARLQELVADAAYRRAHPDDETTRPRFRTGLRAWDRLVGDMRGGHLVILAARPGMGKSALASDLSVLLAGVYGHVAEFQLEMPKEEAVDRKLAQRSWVSFTRVEDPELLSEREHQRLTEASIELDRLPIHLDDTPAISLRELQSKARQIAATAARDRARREAAGESLDGYASPNGMGGVIVDYLQLMTWEGEARTRDEAIGHITRGLKALAKELNVPVIALSQLNRGVETRGGNAKTRNRPTLADLRESGNIENDADKVIFVYREAYYDSEADKRRAELIAGKNRQRATRTRSIGWAGWCMRFHDEEKYDKEDHEEGADHGGSS